MIIYIVYNYYHFRCPFLRLNDAKYIFLSSKISVRIASILALL